MVGKKILSLGLVVLLGVAILAGCSSKDGTKKSTKNDTDNGKTKIGILQIQEHQALDNTRKGFEKAIKEKGYSDKVDIDFKNAQGDQSTNNTIAKKFVDDKKDLLFGIATPSAQALYNSTKDIPILITAVTDPVDAGLVKSLKKPGGNVTGTTDAFDISGQFELLKELNPTAEIVGFIYNTSEVNSEVQLKEAEKIAKKYDLKIKKVGITSTNDVGQAVDSILSQVDVIYTPTDNVIASSMTTITTKATAKQIPVIGSEAAHVKKGALATKGIDYEKLGYKTGLMAIEIIKGKKPENMPIQKLDDLKITLNESVATKLGLEIPDEIKNGAELVGSEVSGK